MVADEVPPRGTDPGLARLAWPAELVPGRRPVTGRRSGQAAVRRARHGGSRRPAEPLAG